MAFFVKHYLLIHLTDTQGKETLLVMSGYLLSVMSQSGLVGFGMDQKFQNLRERYLTYTTNQLVETVSCY